MSGAVLVLNAGSSGIKFALYDLRRDAASPSRLCDGQIVSDADGFRMTAADEAGRPLLDRALPVATANGNQNKNQNNYKEHADHADWLQALLAWIANSYTGITLLAAAHRVVHGGARYSEPTIIDADVLAELRHLIPLAPLHQPQAIAAIASLQRSHPMLPQVACFDAAFHHTMPLVETSYALPRELTAGGVRRYGFHGLSYEYIAATLASVLSPELARGCIIVAHLGSGASLCALRDGRSVATTMSMTPLDGLVMGSRCGALDPGVVLYLLQEKGMQASDVASLLYHQSGLLGISGISADMRVLLASAEPGAAEAVGLFVYRIVCQIGALAAALGGLDALVFTGGIGEHAAVIRQQIGDGAAWLGVAIDPSAKETLIYSPGPVPSTGET